MTPEAVGQVQERILNMALEIAMQEDFWYLRLCKIAPRLGVVPTTPYGTYSNKDELNLMIWVRGFDELFDRLTGRAAPPPNPGLGLWLTVLSNSAFPPQTTTTSCVARAPQSTWTIGG